MMLISEAFAQDIEVIAGAPAAPSAGEAFMWNMGLVLVLVLMFYVLLIRPQQKRFKAHSAMLAALKKGDTVVTGGGLVGKISKITDGQDEVEVDLGGMKVTALRSSLQGKSDARLPANDAPKKAPAKTSKKKAK